MSEALRRAAVALYARVAGSGVFETPVGERLFLAAFFGYKRWIEDPFASLARRHPELFGTGDFIDVGANVGYTTGVFSRVLAPGKRIVAVEPEPLNVRRLRDFVERAGLTERVQVVAAAAGEAAGTGLLVTNPLHPGDHSFVGSQHSAATIEVPTVTIDDVVEQFTLDVSFVKVDVQGWELQVSRGMTGVLAAKPDITVAIEYTPHACLAAGYAPEDVLAFYEERGFGIRVVTRSGELVQLDSPAAVGALEARGYVDLLCRRDFRAATP